MAKDKVLVNYLRQTLLAFCGPMMLAALHCAAAGGDVQPFVEKHCAECHDAETKKGGLDLTRLKFDLANSTNFAQS